MKEKVEQVINRIRPAVQMDGWTGAAFDIDYGVCGVTWDSLGIKHRDWPDSTPY